LPITTKTLATTYPGRRKGQDITNLMKKMSRYLLLALILVALFLPVMATPVSATSTTFYASSYSNTTLQGYGSTYDAAWTKTTGVKLSGSYLDIGQDYSYGDYFIYRSPIIFDTSDIPDDATITGASLKVRAQSKHDPNSYMVLVITEGMPTYPHATVYSSDYNKANYNTTSLGSRSVSSLSLTGYSYISLNSTGRTKINKTGDTKFMLRSSQDIAGNTPNFSGGYPQWVTLWSSDMGTSYAPQLTVTYTVTVDEPTVTTGDPQISSIEENSVRVWGEVTDDGGESCSGRFEYGTTVAYGDYTSWISGLTSDTAFSDELNGLSAGTLYHYRAIASNSGGTDEGADKSILMKPYKPYSVTVTSTSTQNTLDWSKGDGAGKTRIWFRTDTYPTAYVTTGLEDDTVSCNGTEIYFNNGVTYDHVALDNGTTYYYLLISEKTSTYTRYSDSASYAYGTPAAVAAPTVTTNAATGVGDTSVTMNLYLGSLGGDTDADVNFQYYKDGDGAWGESTTPVNKTEPTTFAQEVTGLDAASLYHFRAKAENVTGISYGSSLDFTTGGAAAPLMTTVAASDVLKTTATLHGTVTNAGGSTVTAHFEWGLTTAYGSSSGTVPGLTTGDSAYFNVDGLLPGTLYHFRIVGVNSTGTGYGEDTTFTTQSPGLPTVSTQAASSVGSNSAVLNGLLVDDSGSDCSVRFSWGDTSACENTTGWQPGKQSNDLFNFSLGGLDLGKTYYFIAQASSDGGTSVASGSTLTFTTVFGAPTNLEATALSATSVQLNWTRSGDSTYIYYTTTEYPASRAEGEKIYSGEGTSFLHSNLDPGVTYYYRAWSWSAGDIFSDGYADALASTIAAGAGELERPDTISPPPVPGRLFSAPDYERMSDFFMYSFVNGLAESFAIPKGTFWLGLVVFFSLIMGVSIFLLTHRPLLAALGITGVMGVGYGVALVPLWIIIVLGITSGALIYLEQRG